MLCTKSCSRFCWLRHSELWIINTFLLFLFLISTLFSFLINEVALSQKLLHFIFISNFVLQIKLEIFSFFRIRKIFPQFWDFYSMLISFEIRELLFYLIILLLEKVNVRSPDNLWNNHTLMKFGFWKHKISIFDTILINEKTIFFKLLHFINLAFFIFLS